MSDAPRIDVGKKTEMDGTNTMETEPTGGVEPIAPVLDFRDDEESAVLASQAVELVAGDVRLAGKAVIKLDLVPVPGVYLHGVFDDSRSALALMVRFSQPESISLFDADGQPINGIWAGGNWSADGILKVKWQLLPDPVRVVGNDATQMTQLVAHVFNLETSLWLRSADTMGVFDLGHGPWKGRIRMVGRGPHRIRELRESGGYRLTHIVEFDREGGSFCGKDADRLLQAIRTFLTFTKGGVCDLVCPSGYDDTGKQVWARWSSPSQWRRTCSSWLYGGDVEPLVEVFPGFMDRWAMDGWDDALRTAIWWYAQANSGSSAIDQGIITAQIAMERLAYEYCVCERSLESKGRFEKRPAVERYRLLLGSLDIPIAIPTAATILVAASSPNDWMDSPQALTKIRNNLVHAGRRGAQLAPDGYFEAWDLAAWLLELTILALCNFKGEYRNRITGKKEPVPWTR